MDKAQRALVERMELAAERIERAAERLERVGLEPARTAAAPVRASQSLQEQIEDLLRGPSAPLSVDLIARELGTTEEKIAPLVRELRERGKLYNLGTEDDPLWWWIIGDEAPASEVNAAVMRLISLRPMTFRQLMSATGCRRTRVSGALVEMQKTRKDWQNLGTDKQYVWFLPPQQGGPRYRRTQDEIEREAAPPAKQSGRHRNRTHSSADRDVDA